VEVAFASAPHKGGPLKPVWDALPEPLPKQKAADYHAWPGSLDREGDLKFHFLIATVPDPVASAGRPACRFAPSQLCQAASGSPASGKRNLNNFQNLSGIHVQFFGRFSITNIGDTSRAPNG
jgi:hypothetical protein